MLPALVRVQGGRAVPEQIAVEQCSNFISKVMVELWSRLLVLRSQMEVVISSSTDPVMLHFRSCCTGGLDRLRLFSAIVQCDCSSRHRGTLFQHFFSGAARAYFRCDCLASSRF